MSFYDVLLAQDLNGNGGGSTVTVDTQMSDTSTNPVQNKVIKEYVDERSGFLQCEFTYDAINDKWSCDKTVQEIIEAFEHGNNVRSIFNPLMEAPSTGGILIETYSYEESDETHRGVIFFGVDFDLQSIYTVNYADDGAIIVTASS